MYVGMYVCMLCKGTMYVCVGVSMHVELGTFGPRNSLAQSQSERLTLQLYSRGCKPLELVLLQDCNLHDTLFSSNFVNVEKIGDYLHCQGHLFLPSSPTEFSANGSV